MGTVISEEQQSMSDDQTRSGYTRKVTPIERLFTRSPFSIVTMVARIRGSVREVMVRDALVKVRQRHPNLRVRIVEDERGDPWFTTQGAGEIPVSTVPRESEDHWIQVVQASCRIPFQFDVRPAVRIILVQSHEQSELLILCHHVLCDGLSLAYLARDLMTHLGDPDRDVEVLPDPVPIGRDNWPDDVTANAVVRFLINRMNKKWAGEEVIFDQEDYNDLSEAYWKRYNHQMLSAELTEAQTAALVARCRAEQVTVNSALCAAWSGAQIMVPGVKPYHPSIGVAASLRDRLPLPAGEVMGFYAGAVTPKFEYGVSRGFWDNTRRFHHKVRPLFTNKHLFGDPLAWSHLEPSILEAINFKKLGGLVPERAARYRKLSAFGVRDDVVLRILKRDKMESLDRVFMGTAVTNLTRMDFPRTYGSLELECMFMKPGGAFPLVNVNLVVGAVTCSGKLGMVVEFVEDNVRLGTMQAIMEKAMEFLR